MAPKRPAEEEELESPNRQDDSSDEEELESADVTPNRKDDSSDEEVDSEEEESSDDEETPEKPQSVKPISSKPMNEAPAATTKTKKVTITSTPAAAPASVASKSATTTIPSAKSPSKRALEVKETNERKKRKGDASADVGEKDGEVETDTAKANKSASLAGEDERRNMFQRLYSLDDEVVILKGMVSLRKTGKNPTSHVDELLDNIKGSLSCEVNRVKLSSKVATLKKKYVKNLKKGENLSFSKPHEEKVYQLSKKVWGNAGGGKAEGSDSPSASLAAELKLKKSAKTQGGTTNSSNELGSPRKKVLSLNQISQNVEAKGGDADGEDLSMYPCLDLVAKDGKDYGDMWAAMKDLLSKSRLCLLSSSKKNVLEEKWKKLQEEEVELFFRKMDLLRETAKEVTEAGRKKLTMEFFSHSNTRALFDCNEKISLIDPGNRNNKKINWALKDKQEFIDIVEIVYRGTKKCRGLVIAPNDYSTKYCHWVIAS